MARLRAEGIAHLANGIGAWTDNSFRREIFEWGKEGGFEFVTAIDPQAMVSKRAVVGEGSIVMAGVVVQNGVVIGRNNIIFAACLVGHEAELGDQVLISGSATVGARVVVGHECIFAANATVVSNITLGSNVLGGAGAWRSKISRTIRAWWERLHGRYSLRL